VLLSYLVNNWLELAGVISGLVCVWLLIKENVLTFPVGLIYALITVIVVARANLFADVLLNLYYVLMNAYGWYYWVYGGAQQRQQGILKPIRTSKLTNLNLVAVTLLGSVLMGWVFSEFSNADLAYADSFTTVASFTAMWMTARKHLYSWVAWFIIDAVQIVLYLTKGVDGQPGLFLYAGLYTVYLAMAVIGFRSWQKSMQDVT
jgi:nicotinamide mononucleotide transporter|tara:strand:+ start:34196 stop:34807 length:612 start_codon:yes stop_codon:yes gene_type:complete